MASGIQGISGKSAFQLLAAVVHTYAAFQVSGLWAWVAGVGAAIGYVTGLAGFCLLYWVFGITTCPLPPTASR